MIEARTNLARVIARRAEKLDADYVVAWRDVMEESLPEIDAWWREHRGDTGKPLTASPAPIPDDVRAKYDEMLRSREKTKGIVATQGGSTRALFQIVLDGYSAQIAMLERAHPGLAPRKPGEFHPDDRA